jgi:methylmalonyl-CoA/ethylmalonyl-CoA epimerase
MAKIIKINHIAIAVNDMDSSLGFWEGILGIKRDHTEEVLDQKSIVTFLPVGQTEVELVQPTTLDSGVAKFLADRGPGLHHLCFEVDYIEEMFLELKNKGVRLLSERPLVGEGRKMAFIHPKSTGGVLVELYQITGGK